MCHGPGGGAAPLTLRFSLGEQQSLFSPRAATCSLASCYRNNRNSPCVPATIPHVFFQSLFQKWEGEAPAEPLAPGSAGASPSPARLSVARSSGLGEKVLPPRIRVWQPRAGATTDCPTRAPQLGVAPGADSRRRVAHDHGERGHGEQRDVVAAGQMGDGRQAHSLQLLRTDPHGQGAEAQRPGCPRQRAGLRPVPPAASAGPVAPSRRHYPVAAAPWPAPPRRSRWACAGRATREAAAPTPGAETSGSGSAGYRAAAGGTRPGAGSGRRCRLGPLRSASTRSRAGPVLQSRLPDQAGGLLVFLLFALGVQGRRAAAEEEPVLVGQARGLYRVPRRKGSFPAAVQQRQDQGAERKPRNVP